MKKIIFALLCGIPGMLNSMSILVDTVSCRSAVIKVSADGALFDNRQQRTLIPDGAVFVGANIPEQVAVAQGEVIWTIPAGGGYREILLTFCFDLPGAFLLRSITIDANGVEWHHQTEYSMQFPAAHDAVPVSTDVNTPVDINLEGLYSGGTGIASAAIMVYPMHGTITLTETLPYIATYTPATGYQGYDSFVYYVTDNSCGNVGTVLVKVGDAQTFALALHKLRRHPETLAPIIVARNVAVTVCEDVIAPMENRTTVIDLMATAIEHCGVPLTDAQFAIESQTLSTPANISIDAETGNITYQSIEPSFFPDCMPALDRVVVSVRHGDTGVKSQFNVDFNYYSVACC